MWLLYMVRVKLDFPRQEMVVLSRALPGLARSGLAHALYSFTVEVSKVAGAGGSPLVA